MHCLYATIESFKIKPEFICREDIPILGDQNSPMFWLFQSLHEPVVKLGYADRMAHCGMFPSGVADSIEFQLTSLRETEALACSFDTDFNYGLFWQ